MVAGLVAFRARLPMSVHCRRLPLYLPSSNDVLKQCRMSGSIVLDSLIIQHSLNCCTLDLLGPDFVLLGIRPGIEPSYGLLDISKPRRWQQCASCGLFQHRCWCTLCCCWLLSQWQSLQPLMLCTQLEMLPAGCSSVHGRMLHGLIQNTRL